MLTKRVETVVDGVKIVDLFYPVMDIEKLFPSFGEEGDDVRATVGASRIAELALGATDDEVLMWHTPDTFSIRYGSSYVATAVTATGDRKVRFHTSDQGDFKDGDDK